MIRTFARTSLLVFTIVGLSSFGVSNAEAQTTSTGGGSGSSPSLGATTQTVQSQPSAATTSASANSINAPFRIPAPQFGDYKLRLGLKSQNTTGRLYDFDSTKGTRYKQKHEYFLGAVHASGWGGYVQGVASGTITGEANSVTSGDPSVTLLHPDYYRGNSLTIAGQARRYFAVSERSVANSQKQWAYYLFETLKMPARWTIWNQTVPRYFQQAFYKPTDTNYYVEDTATLSKEISTRVTLGLGQWTQVEGHDKTATGVSVDAFLFARYTPIANLWIEPRLIAPAYIKNAVYDQSKNVSVSGTRAELYAQMTL